MVVPPLVTVTLLAKPRAGRFPPETPARGLAEPSAPHHIGYWRKAVRQHHVRPDGLPPVNGYSHAVAFSGRMIAVSGQVPLDGEGRIVGQDDPTAQVRQVFENLKNALAAAGAGMQDVVKLTIYLTDLADLEAFRLVRDEYIAVDKPPASSLVQVSGLVNPAFRVEIDALAAI
jgi:reactive intermediate/imine deaminase